MRAEESPLSQRRRSRACVGPRVSLSCCTERVVPGPGSVRWGLLIKPQSWRQEPRRLGQHPAPRVFRELAVETTGAAVSQSPTGAEAPPQSRACGCWWQLLLSGGGRVAFLSIFEAECPQRLAPAFPPEVNRERRQAGNGCASCNPVPEVSLSLPFFSV